MFDRSIISILFNGNSPGLRKIVSDPYCRGEIQVVKSLPRVIENWKSEKATAEYLEVEKKIRASQDSDAVLVSVDSMAALRRAYPNYFLDAKVFVNLMSETLKSTRSPPKRSGRQLSLFREK